MARTRALDHDEKRLAILQQSAHLFAAQGYDRVSVSMLARACNISKALLYHYFNDKSQLLFEIIRDHLENLLAATALPDPVPVSDPAEHLHWIGRALLRVYQTSDSKHHVQINQLHLLPRPQQKLLKDLERKLVDRFAAAVAPCVPPAARDRALLKPLTMSLFGMFNWNYLWFREDGPVSRDEYARLAVTLLIEGSKHLSATSFTGHPVPGSRPASSGNDAKGSDGKARRARKITAQTAPGSAARPRTARKRTSGTVRRGDDDSC